jgi:hypothetical protein
MLLSKPDQYLPPSPDAAAEIHKGVGAFMTPAANIKAQKSEVRSQKNEYPVSSIQYPVKGGKNERI